MKSRAYGLPQGRVRERLGSIKSERAISLIAIHAHGIPNRFRNDAVAEAEAARPAPLEGREDWRALPLVTIDPPDAKDHDDAVHTEPDPDPATEDTLWSRRRRALCGRLGAEPRGWSAAIDCFDRTCLRRAHLNDLGHHQ
jgi:hypothetical protein